MPRPAFLYDDAYITLQNALALWNGGDPHYPDALSLSGATSPFHLLIVAGLLTFLPPEWALLTSCLAGTGVYAAALWALARGEGLTRPESAAIICAGLGVGMLSQHLVNGLETSWTLAGVTWAIKCARTASTPGFAAVCATLPFIRPELVILATALLLDRAVRQKSEAGTLAIATVAAIAPWLILMFVTTGGLVPTTLAAKRDWYAEGCWSVARRATVVGTGIWLWLRSCAFLSFGVLGLSRVRIGRVAAGAMVVTIIIWSTQVPDVLYGYQRHRYYVPFVPLLILGTLMLGARVRRLLTYGAAALAVITTAAVVRLEPAAIAGAQSLRTRVVDTLKSRGARRVMVHDAGYLAYADAAPTLIDMVGLKTPAAAALNHRLTGPSCGARRGDALAALATETAPDYLVVWEPWDQFFAVTDNLRRSGWRAEKIASLGSREPIAIFTLTPPATGRDGDHSPGREGR
jgi:hypothetical protein